jgi:hypothetical protein
MNSAAPCIVGPEIWVGEMGSGQVRKIAADGQIAFSLAEFGWPVSLASHPSTGQCWVADSYSHRLILLSQGGMVMHEFSDSYLSYPSCIELGEERDVYAASTGTGIIFNVSGGGDLLGTGTGFTKPASLTFDGSNEVVWVADSQYPGVLTLSKDLTSILGVSIPMRARSVDHDGATGKCWAADSVQAGVFLFRDSYLVIEGSMVGKYAGAHYVLADPLDHGCWVLYDSSEHQLVKLTSQLTEVYVTGGFSNPRCMDYEPVEGVLWIADSYHNELAKVDPHTGQVMRRFDGFDIPVSIEICSSF